MDCVATGSVAPRLDIQELAKNKPMWYLYLKGMQAFQKRDAKSDRSYYTIAGIHGRPYTAYNGVEGRKPRDWEINRPSTRETRLSAS